MRRNQYDPMREIDLLLLEDIMTMTRRNFETNNHALAFQTAALSAVVLLLCGIVLHSVARPAATVAAVMPAEIGTSIGHLRVP
jgi:hypothetical protein